jgi:cyclic pyranopterin phosphate synthase
MSAKIVDVGDKDKTEREATAEAVIRMTPQAAEELVKGTRKGNPIEAARIAALQGIKKTPDLLPFCHPIAVTGASVDIDPRDDGFVVRVTVRAFDRTGVEMEALTGASVGALCLYDTAKAFDRAAVIENVRLLSKTGGKSGDYAAVE